MTVAAQTESLEYADIHLSDDMVAFCEEQDRLGEDLDDAAQKFEAALQSGLDIPCVDGRWDERSAVCALWNIIDYLKEKGYPRRDMLSFID